MKELNDSELDKRINIFLLWKIKRKNANKFAIQTVQKLQNFHLMNKNLWNLMIIMQA